MFLLLGLFFCAGLTHVVNGYECHSEALRCIVLYRPLNTYQKLHETSSHLTRECILQSRFYACMSKIPPECYSEHESPLSEDLEKMKDALLELCSERSELSERYLLYAPCINKQDTDYCTSEEYLGTEMELEPSPEKRCELTMKSRHCIAHLLKDECGGLASDLFKELTFSFTTDDHCVYDEDDYYTEDDMDGEDEYDYEDEDTSELISPRKTPDTELDTDAQHKSIPKKTYSRVMTDFAKRSSFSEESEYDGDVIPDYGQEALSPTGKETTDRPIIADSGEHPVAEASGEDETD